MTSPARRPDPGDANVAHSRPRSRLTLVDWSIRVPIGFLYLIFILILAVPVMIWMTALYAAARGWARIMTAIGSGTTNGGAVNGARGA